MRGRCARRIVTALAVAAVACGGNPGPAGVPPNRGNTYLDRFIRAELPQGDLPGCALEPISPGSTWNAALGLNRFVPLPRTYANPPYMVSETGRMVGGNFASGLRWRPGLGFIGGGQLWTRTDLSAMIRFGSEGYAELVLGEDWMLAAPHECTMEIAGVPARVLLFELTSARHPTQYGLTGHWRTRAWRSGVLVLSDTPRGRQELMLSLQLISP
jgi:hypothetical protein